MQNNACRKNNILHFQEFKLNDNCILEAGSFDIKQSKICMKKTKMI